jgi:hypothetical protein
MGNTSISYMYRDASNWKRFNTIILEGELKPQDIDFIFDCLEDQLLFLPEQVGLPTLQKDWESLDERDHVWHELDRKDIRLVNESPTTFMTAKAFLEKFRPVYFKGWDVSSAVRNLRKNDEDKQ